ncbi:hypothetical protein [Ferruginibacter albus]|uniref:hypothetical protein n=1 Tax=Ferruginibacter albus TaxID=2875540 RepID=UPI001CC524F4|nr:hypothetical protein [Ferruginibacter albus]UAY51046.1 hypothetical protein K9M53_10640 [Ferruginibacter albus]
MKHLPLLVILFFLNVTISYSQPTTFSFKRPIISKLDSIEYANHGKTFYYNGITFSVSKNYFPHADSFKLGQPINSSRQKGPTNINICYYYSLPDSVIRLSEYSWDQSKGATPSLNEIFTTNATLISKYFGNNGKTKLEDHEDWTQKTTIWENKEVHVEQFMVSSEYTNRVRVLISWK